MTDHNAVLKDGRQLGPYPDHLLKRLDVPTVAIPGPVERRKQGENAGAYIRRGDMGPELVEKASDFFGRYPLGGVIGEVRERMMHPAPVDPVAPEPPKLDIPESPSERSRHLKALAYFLGADAVGICKAPPSSFFADDAMGSPYESSMTNALVVLKRNDLDTTMATNGQDWIVDATAQRTYLHLTMITEIVASYIKMIGFGAESSNLRNFKSQMPPLVIAAGLGEASRMGIALNPFFGADYKVSAVMTDMAVTPDKPIDFGLQEYCSRCGICAKHCLGGAISKGTKELYNGYEKWYFDAMKCFSSTLNLENGSNCFTCIMMCPWTRPDTTPDDFRKWDGSTESLIADVDARAEQLRKNGYVRKDAPGAKWWLRLIDKPEGSV